MITNACNNESSIYYELFCQGIPYDIQVALNPKKILDLLQKCSHYHYFQNRQCIASHEFRNLLGRIRLPYSKVAAVENAYYGLFSISTNPEKTQESILGNIKEMFGSKNTVFTKQILTLMKTFLNAFVLGQGSRDENYWYEALLDFRSDFYRYAQPTQQQPPETNDDICMKQISQMFYSLKNKHTHEARLDCILESDYFKEIVSNRKPCKPDVDAFSFEGISKTSILESLRGTNSHTKLLRWLTSAIESALSMEKREGFLQRKVTAPVNELENKLRLEIRKHVAQFNINEVWELSNRLNDSYVKKVCEIEYECHQLLESAHKLGYRDRIYTNLVKVLLSQKKIVLQY